jgi:quercetin dioxygenase-like cupin family protein
MGQVEDDSLKAGAAAVVKHAEAVERRPVTAGTATERQVLLGPDDGAPHFAMRRFLMGTGGGMPRHTNTVEHQQYVLRGRARVGVGATVHEVGPDDVLYIPAGTPHFYEVVEAPFEFLCVVPDAPDRIEVLAATTPPAPE